MRIVFPKRYGKLTIGKNFKCNSKTTSNSIGLIQPCIINCSEKNSSIIIGNNVGISGITICAKSSVKIGDNTIIGSGCIITDSDAHPISWEDRLHNPINIDVSPILIEENCFIGARSIILKGVTIGKGSVIGAGSVVTKDIPAHSIACGNPAVVVKTLSI